MPVSPLRTIRNLAAFLAGVTLTCLVFAQFASFPQVGNVWRKYVHLQEHKDKYSVIYIGSSRVFHEFLPAQFDAAMAKRGHPTTSFNYGQDGMWPPESLYMVEQILALHPKNLKWVFIDLMPIKPYIQGGEITARAEYWHDWKHTWMAMKHCATSPDYDRGWSERLDYCYTHLFLWAERSLNAGVGSQHFLVAMKLDREKRPEPVADGGWENGPDRHLTEQEKHDFKIETGRLPGLPPNPIDPLLRDALNNIVTKVRAAGAEPIFVVASGFYARERFADWPPPGVTVLAFDDPVRYPELYNPDHRFDMYHLDARGAADATRFLSDRFAEYLEAKTK